MEWILPAAPARINDDGLGLLALSGKRGTVHHVKTNSIAKLPSAAARRRERDALLQARRTVVPLPESCVTYLDGFQPEDVPVAQWDAVRPVVVAVMHKSQITSRDVFVRACRQVAMFFVWRHDNGLSVAIDDALMPIEIDRWVAAHPDWSGHAANSNKSRLRKVAQVVNTNWPTPVAGSTRGHQKVRPPYTADEMDLIVNLAKHQAADGLRRQLCAIVGFCGGAGLAAEDLRSLRKSHIECLPDGIVVRVPGRRPRSTVVLADCEELVHVSIEPLRANDLVIKEREDRSNVTGQILDSIVYGDTDPRIDTYRLRNTWLVTQLRRDIPLKVLMAAAGLKSVRTLSELLSYVDAPTPMVAVEQLRHAGSR